MIIRIVQMTFMPEKVATFLELFAQRKAQIRGFDGCRHLELWQDKADAALISTYSIWESEKHLDHYRYSELFKATWAETKKFFSDKPKAQSLIQLY